MKHCVGLLFNRTLFLYRLFNIPDTH